VRTKGELEPSSRAPWWRRPDAIAIGVVLALTIVVMWHRWVFDNWLARHDLLTFFLPWLGTLGDRLAAFDIPSLNPYVFSGAPFAGDPESGWMYLPAMLAFPFFEVTVAYKVMILILLVLAGTSTYALARVIGYSVVAALFSAVAFEFGPFLYGQTDCCTVGTKLTAFLPLAFLGVELALRAKTWPSRLAAWTLGGFAISQMFAAWLGQGVVNALILVAAWVVYRTLISPPEAGWAWTLKERIIQLATTGPAVLIAGLLLGAAGILPRLVANAESNNAGGTYENTPGSVDYPFHTLDSALKTILADVHGYRATSVWGTVFVLMLLGVFLMRRRSVIPFFAVVAVVIPALAMNASPIADIFYLLPLYEEIHSHSPGRVFWIYPFIPAMLAGAAINELPRLPTMHWKWAIAVAPLALTAMAVWYVDSQSALAMGRWHWISVLLTTIAVLIAAAPGIVPVPRVRTIHGVSVVLVALAFLLPNGRDLVNTVRQDEPIRGELVMWANDPWMQGLIHESLRRDDPGGAGEFLQRQQETEPPFRFIAYGGMYHPETIRQTYPTRRLQPAMVAILQNSRAMRLMLETTQGYNPLQPLVYQEFIHALNGQEQDYHYANLLYTGVSSPLLDLLNVRYIVVDRNISENRDDHLALAESRTEVYRDENVIIYESPSAQPRAWMVYDVRPGGEQDGLAQLASGAVDGAEVAFVQGEAPDVSPPADGSEPEVRIAGWSPDAMTIEVAHAGEGLLVVSQVYSEGWKATVDGEEVEVLQTDHALLGIPVEPGEHRIALHYAPDALATGIWISGLSGLGAMAILGYAGWANLARRRQSWLLAAESGDR